MNLLSRRSPRNVGLSNVEAAQALIDEHLAELEVAAAALESEE